jgi:hypothetical protein
MSAPLIWIILPGLAGLVFWFFRERQALVVLLGTILGLLLALGAFLLPVGQVVQIASWSFRIEPDLMFAGRRLLLENSDRPILIFFFMVCAFWFAGAAVARANALLIPFGYGIVALLIAALAVEPFLYAALLIEMAVLLAVPVVGVPIKFAPGKASELHGSAALAPDISSAPRGLLRFLIFQTLAFPFILLAGWALEAFEINPARTDLALMATVCLGLGFAFWLAVFPFYSWIPLLVEENAPYHVGFVLLVLSAADLLLGLNFLARYNLLNTSLNVLATLRVVGVLMIGTAGIWSIFQTNLLRLFGYAVIVETGFSLLALSLYNQIGRDLFASMFLPRLIGLGLWSLALAILLPKAPSAYFRDVAGLAARYPFACAALGTAALSLGGLPLLGDFPIRQVLMEELAAQSLLVGLVALVGTVGMLFGAFRTLAVLARDLPFPIHYLETRLQVALLVLGLLGLLAIGTLPPVFLPLLFPLAHLP